MPNAYKGLRPHAKEALERAVTVTGSDPVATRVVRGQLTYAVSGYGFQRIKQGAIGDDEAAPAWSVVALTDNDKARVFQLRRFSAAELYLDFTNPGASTAADVTAYRVNDNGDLVVKGQWTSLGHRAAFDDPDVQGRDTLYVITNVTADGATALRLKCAGEGLGYRE